MKRVDMHKHPNSNHPYRASNNGSEGGGYSLSRIPPGGPGQGAQDPKSQPPQQSLSSGSMSMGYTPNQRGGGQAYYAQRPHPPQRMGNGGGPRVGNIQHMPATTAVYAAAISPSNMIQQPTSFMSSQGCSMLLPQMQFVNPRHPGQASGNQQQNYFQTIPMGCYGSAGQPLTPAFPSFPVLFQPQSIRGYNPQNPAANSVIQQQPAPQQATVSTVYMEQVGGGAPQVSMAQLGSGPGGMNGAQHMMGPQAPAAIPIVSPQAPPQGQLMPGQPPKDSKSRRKFAIPIINPSTLQEIHLENESKILEDGGSNSTDDSSSSHLPSTTMTGPPTESAVAVTKKGDRKKDPLPPSAVAASEKTGSSTVPAVSGTRGQQPPSSSRPGSVPTQPQPTPTVVPNTEPISKPKASFAEQISFSKVPFQSSAAPSSAVASAPSPAPTPAPTEKGANGETDAPVGKVLQRPKKKPNQIRRGVDKSGTVMDAFFDSDTAPAATQPSPAPRDPSPPPPAKEPTPPAAPVVEPPSHFPAKNSTIAPVVEVEFLQKDEIETKENDAVADNNDYSTGNDIDAMVAAKNEENTKVSEAANNNNNNNNITTNSVTPEIVKDDEEANKENEVAVEQEENEAEPQNIKSMTIERSSAQPTLKHKYKENQWSPINRDGEKVYDREFLLQIKNTELALKKPEFPIDLEIFRDKPNDAPTNNRQNRPYGSSSMSSRGDSFGGLSYQRSSNSSSNQRSGSSKNNDRRDRGPSSRPMSNSQSGNRSMGSKPFNLGHPSRDEPQLHRDPNGGWKLYKFQDTNALSMEQKEIDKLKRQVRGILNKLTPQKFEKLLGQIMELPINTKQHMDEMVTLVFEKAVDEPSFSKAYADLCSCLQKKSVTISPEGGEGKTESTATNFRKLLLNKCQGSFEKIREDELDIEERMKEIEETTDVEKKKELRLLLEDAERRIRRKSVGLVRFIGELYKLQMLTPKIMQGCITTLLVRIGEEPLECLCKLMTTIGKELEKELAAKEFEQYFVQMGKLARKSPDSEVSSRIRFMLQDVIELRERGWKPRRDENNPKTLHQIEKEAFDAEIETAALNNNPSNSNSRKNQNDDRNRGRPARMNQENDGWQIMGSKYRTGGNSYAVTPDASKLQSLKAQGDLSEMSFGGPETFRQWTGGASGNRTGNDSSRNLSSSSFSNQYAILRQEDRIKSLSPSSSSSMGSKVMRDRDKEDSYGRMSSKPSSRESSRSRYGPSPAGSLSSRMDRYEPPSSRNYQRDNRDVPKSQSPPPKVPKLNEEEGKRKADTVFYEWCANNNIKETTITVRESFVGEDNVSLLINVLLSKLIDGKRPDRLKFAELLVVLRKENICSSKQLVNEFTSLVEFADDMIVDIPLFWSFLGEIIAPLVCKEVFKFDDIKAFLEKHSLADREKVILEVMKVLVTNDKTEIWAVSGAQIQDFVPKENLETFINKNQFLFLSSTFTANVFIKKHRDTLVDILRSEKNDAFDEACAFLSKVEDSVSKKAFIEIVSMAVIKASLKDNKLVGTLLQKHEKLIQKYVDNQEELELYCLCAIKNYLLNEVVLETSVLVDSFENLYDHNVISVEGFKKWRVDDSKEPHVAAGRSIALSALDPFYVSLVEADDDEDEDES